MKVVLWAVETTADGEVWFMSVKDLFLSRSEARTRAAYVRSKTGQKCRIAKYVREAA